MSSSKEVEGSAVPAASKGSWTSFLKSIASFNGDLASLTAPPFILGIVSLVEFSSYWAEHPSIFVAPAAEQDPEKRALLVLKWFLSTLKQQYCSRSDALGSEKKPLNPFLGELFLAQWEDQAGITQLVSEQVSHHPPATAYSIWNQQHGVRLQGYNAQKASFSRTIHVRQIGHAVYHIDAFEEDYLISLPAVHIEGLYVGSPFVELSKTTTIVSSSGYTSKIDYSGKGWMSGKKNSFTATLYKEGHEKDVLYSVDGQWNDTFTIKKGSSKHGSVVDTYRQADHPTTKLSHPAFEGQSPRESDKAWRSVKDAIIKGDMDAASHEKTKIEVQQREMRKKEQAEGREWQRTFFTHVETHPVFEKLSKSTGEKLEADKTGGIWRFDVDKFHAAKRPFTFDQ